MLGFILGVFFYICIYIVTVVIRRRVESPRCMANYAKSRIVGEIYYDNEPHGISKLCHSKLAMRLRHRGGCNTESQLNKCADSIKALSENAKEDVTFLDLTNKHTNLRRSEIINQLIDKMQKKRAEFKNC